MNFPTIFILSIVILYALFAIRKFYKSDSCCSSKGCEGCSKSCSMEYTDLKIKK
ncbi:MAG: FeoB-associated Cys-rich membrane protein [Peptostreptococcaceae bacterium]|nr:FeoB-associated Cys-rich membrane protein [Peptostreptococcaceae bacterium]